jgi:hypothetical protein
MSFVVRCVCCALVRSLSIYLSIYKSIYPVCLTAVAVFRKPNAIPLCFSIDLVRSQEKKGFYHNDTLLYCILSFQ